MLCMAIDNNPHGKKMMMCTDYEAFRIVGDTIEVKGEPFAKLIVSEYRKEELIAAIKETFMGG